MKPAAILRDIATYARKALRRDPNARLCVGSIVTKEDGTEAVAFMMINADRGDTVQFADTLLRSVSEQILNGSHPDCETCRGHLKQIEAARASLGLQVVPERTS